MTITRDMFCKKKTLIYIASISFIVIVLVTALVVVFVATRTYHDHFEESEEWNYNDQDKWPGFCTTSKQQSPIALNQTLAYKKVIPPIRLENFQKYNDSLTVQNSGHTVSVSIPTTCECQRPKLSGGGLAQNYTLDNFHFHWPSEHTIDGLRYDLEAHFVFYADEYEKFQEAINHPYGVTVMAVVFVETNYTESNNFRILADAVKAVSSTPGISTTTIKPINFDEFLPYDHEIFFTYDGSLTTPDCAEFVNWIVYKNHANISYLDLKDLITIYDHDNNLLVANNRLLQDINDRTIYIQSTPS